MEPIPKWQRVTGWVLSGLMAVVFLPSAFFKIAQPEGFIEEWSKTYPANTAVPIGVIELAVFVLYLIPKTRYLGGMLMLAYLGGAVATHVHANDGKLFVPVIIGVIAWLGLYLRDRKLRRSSRSPTHDPRVPQERSPPRSRCGRRVRTGRRVRSVDCGPRLRCRVCYRLRHRGGPAPHEQCRTGHVEEPPGRVFDPVGLAAEPG